MQQLIALQIPAHFLAAGEITSNPNAPSSALQKLKAILLQASKTTVTSPDQQSYTKCYHIALSELKEVNSLQCSHLSDEAIEELDLSLFEKVCLHNSRVYLPMYMLVCALLLTAAA